MWLCIFKQLKKSGDSEILEMADGNGGDHLFKEQNNSHTQYNYMPEFHT